MKLPKIKLFPKVNTYLGFPIGEPEPGEPKDSARQKGIAIIVALFMITMMTLFMADMQVNAVVSSELAIANRDNLKAEYIAKSGGNLANFLLGVDLAMDLTMVELQGGQGGATDSPSDMWAQMNGYPIGGDTVELLSTLQEGFDLSTIGDSEVMDTFKEFDGHFIINVADEASRVNINFCAINATQGRCRQVMKQLTNCPAEKEYLERRKINGTELVANIIDWIDTNNEADPESGRGSESDVYQNREPKVNVKNSYFDSLDELNVVAGWSQDLSIIFTPYLTVYPMPLKAAQENTALANFQINFNTASQELLTCLFPKSTTECSEKSALYGAYRADQEVPKDAASIQNVLRDTYCADDELSKIFTYRSDIYRVTVQGSSGLQSKTLEYVVARQKPDDQDQRNDYKSAIKYLYWKML